MDAFAYILSFFVLIVGYLFYLTIKQMNEIAEDVENTYAQRKISEAWHEHRDDIDNSMSLEDFRTCLEQRENEKFDQMNELEQLISELNTLTEFGVLPDRIGGDVIDKLCKITDTQAVEALIKAAENPNFSMRMGAIYALGEIDDKRTVDSLVNILSDKDKDIRDCAVETLDKLGWDPDSA